jgi:anion transporter
MQTGNHTVEISIGSAINYFSLRPKKAWALFAAFVVGVLVWSMPPVGAMSAEGMHFFATMIVAITLWMLDIFDEYIVGLMLLLAWVVFGIVPAKVALAGFSQNSWFFTIGALGIAAAIGQTTLLHRLSLRLLHWIPIHCQSVYTLFLLSAGVLAGPLLPTGKARAAVAVPVSQAVTEAAGFDPRSNGSAAISLSAFIGFSQMSFMFLTGGEHCLIGWNFLPPDLKAEFGWVSWFVVAFPAALFISAFMFMSMQFLFPLSPREKQRLLARATQPKLTDAGPISQREWITLLTMVVTVLGWLTNSFHGINEAWVALAALLVFLLTGILDRESFKNKIDWGLILFFGVLNSMAAVIDSLKVDDLFMVLSAGFLSHFAEEPFGFLLMVCALVATVRFFLRKGTTATLFSVAVLPLSVTAGIHSGVVIVVAIMAGECFLLGYQDGPYQIAYGGIGGNAFSHRQARKVLAAKYLATFLAVAVSIPYWRFLGYIR